MKRQRYKLVQFENGCWGVKEFFNRRYNTVAAGMTKAKADAWMDRLRLRAAWGT